MSSLLKRLTWGMMISTACLILLIFMLRFQVIQYLAAYTGHGFAKTLPVLRPESEQFRNTTVACTSQQMNVLTYNVRYGSALIEALRRPLGNHAPGDYLPWSARYPEIRSRIDSYTPDLIGLQEMHTDRDIGNIVPLQQYTLVTYHMNAFHYGDSALLFKTSRFDILDSGQLWLGPNSTLPLSLGFKPLAMIRYVNWAILREKIGGFTFLFVNTHFDNNAVNREKSSDVFYKHIARLTTGYPMVVVGDFNSSAVTERYQRLTGSGGTAPLLINSYDLAISDKTDGAPNPDEMIDHILVGGPCATRVSNWAVDKRTLASGDTLSDHDPVLAQLQFTGQKMMD
ncbi:MAG: endonuclease/exonuclease/phosphatase family protein [Methylococcales bacterium]|nr:endonuclease/exonuclease/phosphatase family protein [Methylococcales bacterium]